MLRILQGRPHRAKLVWVSFSNCKFGAMRMDAAWPMGPARIKFFHFRCSVLFLFKNSECMIFFLTFSFILARLMGYTALIHTHCFKTSNLWAMFIQFLSEHMGNIYKSSLFDMPSLFFHLQRVDLSNWRPP